MYQAIIDELKTKRIVILGFGREGRSTWNFLREHLPKLPLAVADRNPDVQLPRPDPHTTLLCGPDYLDRLDGYDLLIKTPGISLLGVRLPDGIRVTCQTDLFLRHATCTTIGISGTKGKSTTTSLVFHMLQEAGRHALLMGNIGVPVFDRISEVRPDSVAVIELSSHQLEYVHASPYIAILTNLYPEHLDHYGSYEAYVSAKMNLVRYQRSQDICVYNADQAELRERVTKAARGRILPVALSDAYQLGLSDDLESRNPHLAGEHNLYDALLAATACMELGVGLDAIYRGLAAFAGMPHRMQIVGRYHGIRFVDNAIATIPESTLLAIRTLRDVDTLLVGGMDRGLDYREFARQLAESEVHTVICMPDTGKTIQDLLEQHPGTRPTLLWADEMDEAVRLAYLHTGVGRTCLLSPTAASYNRFKDFEEKGDLFQQCVKELGNSKSDAEETEKRRQNETE